MIDNLRKPYFQQRSLAQHLNNLHRVNIRFKNEGNAPYTAELFELNDKVIKNDTTDGNTGVVYAISVNGAQLPSDNVQCIDGTVDYLFVATNQGIWLYDRATQTGVTYTTASGATNGQQLPNNDCYWCKYDPYRYTLWVGTNGGGVWQYNLVTDTGKVYNASGGAALGDQLPNNIVTGIGIDFTNNVIYAGTQAGMWQYSVTLDTGKTYNNAGGAGSGDQIPDGFVVSCYYDNLRQIVYTSGAAGAWQYNIGTDTGKAFTVTGGAGSGDQMPANFSYNSYIEQATNILYVCTIAGVWVYNVATDTGSVINTSTLVLGDLLPSNNTVCAYFDSDANLWIGTGDSGMWKYNTLTGVGRVYNSTTKPPTSGESPGADDFTSVTMDSNSVLLTSLNSGGLWLLDTPTDEGSVFRAPDPGMGGGIPSNIVFGIMADTQRNEVWGATLGGAWRYMVASDTGEAFTVTGGAGSGDQLPSNTCSSVYVCCSTGIVYIGTFLGLWQYDYINDVGKVYNSTGGAASGDQLPDNLVLGVFKDTTKNKLYVATNGGFWIYDITTGEGKAFTDAGGAASGDQLPANATTSAFKKQNDDIIWVTTNGAGVWKYDEVADEGKVYNTTGGAGNGSQLPDLTTWQGLVDDNVVYITTFGGVWVYNTATDTGSIINSSTAISSGDQMPEDNCIGIAKDTTKQILWVGTQSNGIWQYELSPDRGALYNSVGGQSEGQGVPADNIQDMSFDGTNNNLWAATRGGGIWQYVLNNSGLLGSAFLRFQTSAAEYILQTLDIKNTIIIIYHLKIVITGVNVLNNLIRYIRQSPFGARNKGVLILAEYLNSEFDSQSNIIDVPVPDGILLDDEHLFEYPTDVGEIVDMTIYFKFLYEKV